MERPSQATRPKKGTFECPDNKFLLEYPTLAKAMCDPWWDDGKARKLSSLKMTMTEADVTLCLTEPDSKLVSFTTASGLVEALLALETALSDKSISWRKSKY